MTPGELREAHRPIGSLISKSEKAQQKLAPGTWQHTMLQNNLRALHIASALMTKEASDGSHFEREALQNALGALASMVDRAEKAQAGFVPGTSHHALQKQAQGVAHRGSTDDGGIASVRWAAKECTGPRARRSGRSSFL